MTKQAQEIEDLKAENKRLRESCQYLWKSVERGMWCDSITPELAIKNCAYYPDAPWNVTDGFWVWDTSHKPYDDKIKQFSERNK